MRRTTRLARRTATPQDVDRSPTSNGRCRQVYSGTIAFNGVGTDRGSGLEVEEDWGAHNTGVEESGETGTRLGSRTAEGDKKVKLGMAGAQESGKHTGSGIETGTEKETGAGS